MSNFSFGIGDVYLNPTTDLGPIRLGAVQGVNLNFDGDIKELFGRNQYALDTARGKVKVSGSIDTAKIDALVYNEIFFTESVSNGQIMQASDEVGTVAATTPFTYQATNHGGEFDTDLGVLSTTGKPYRKVATTDTPAAGEYNVTGGGLYTFHTSAGGRSLIFNYLYTDDANGQTITLSNALMGSAPSFGLVVSNKYKGGNLLMQLYNVTAPKLTFPFKQDDYLVNSIDFNAYCNAAGVLGRLSQWNGDTTVID